MDQQRQSIVITGGSGLIGRALVEHFAPDFHVFSLDRDAPDEPLPHDAEFIEADLTDNFGIMQASALISGRSTAPIASVIHLAAYYDFSGEPSELYEKLTVHGTGHLLRAVRDMAVHQFIFSSTMLVHRPTEPGRPITEEHPLEAHWDYPRSKIEAESTIRRFRDHIPAVLLRIAGVYTDEGDSIPLAQQIERIHQRRLTARVYPGELDHGQAFVHLDDLVDAIARTVQRRDELPEEIEMLIGEPETVGYGRLQQELARLIHDEPDWTTRTIPKAVAKTGAWVRDEIPGLEDPFIKPWMIDLADDHYELDISRARSLLGWEPKHRLIRTLPAVIDRLRADPAGWYRRHDLEPPEGAQPSISHPAARRS